MEHLEHLAPTLLFLAPKGRLVLIRLCQVRRGPLARTERKGRLALIRLCLALPARTGHLEHLEPIQLCQALKAPLALTELLDLKGPQAPRLYRLTLATTPRWEPMA
jgi:hypothetical protein